MLERRRLGRTGLEVGRLGVSASYGVPAAAVVEAFEHGANYLYYGSRRTARFALALRELKPRRERVVLAVQSYTRAAGLLGWSLERALRSVGYDYADVLLLGMWNRPVPERILDACRRLRERGLVRFFAQSTHHRPLVARQAGGEIDIFHVRYNVLHPGAERDVFPLLPAENRPGIVTFTSTSWGQALKKGATAADCYRFALTQPAVDVCVCGPSNAQHLREALAAAHRGPLDPQEWERLRLLAPGKR